jgi:hypothetical protein
VAQNAMPRLCSRVVTYCHDQLAPTKVAEAGLDGALGKSRCLGEHPQTCPDRFPLIPRGLAIQMQINKIRCGLVIVSDKIAHQDVDDVVINWNASFKTRHSSNDE